MFAAVVMSQADYEIVLLALGMAFATDAPSLHAFALANVQDAQVAACFGRVR